MSIIERPLLGTVDIETPDYATMGFVLGLSRVGDKLGTDVVLPAGSFILGVSHLGDTFADPPAPANQWLTWIRNATEITIKRGFVRRGIGLRTDVGIMSFTMRSDQNPLVKPEPYTPWTLARTNLDINPSPVATTTGWATGTSTTLTPTPAGMQIDLPSAGAAAACMYSSVQLPATAGQRWAAAREVRVPAGYPAVTVYLRVYSYGENVIVADSGPVAIQPGQGLTVQAPSVRTIGSTTTGVRSILYITGPAGTRVVVPHTLTERAAAPGVIFDGNTASTDLEQFGWTGAPNASTSTCMTRARQAPHVSMLQPGQILRGVQHTFGGTRALFTGTISDVSAAYVLDKQSGEMTTATTVTVSDAVLTHTQTMRYGARIPTGSEIFEERIARLEATSRVPLAVPPRNTAAGAYPQRLRSTVYESDLASHFDLACNSVGAAWFADVDNVTQFTGQARDLPVSVVFSDVKRDGALLYTDIDAGYDTASLVNVLDVVNHGIGPDGLADDDELSTSNPQSVSLYGPRREDIDVNIHTLADDGAALRQRLADVLSAGDEPQLLIRSVTWNAQQNIDAVPSLELGQRARVEFNGTVQDSRLIGIEHKITAARWMVSVKFSTT